MTGYFVDLERELVTAAERQRALSTSAHATGLGRRLLNRRLRAAALALGLLVVAGVPAAAMTGVFRPHRESDGLVRLSERVVVADGSTPDRGRWQILVSRSNAGFCLGIRLPTGVPGDHGTQVSEGCGGPGPGSLTVATVSGGDVRRNGLAFGSAPDRAAQVRVEARGVAVTVETIDDELGLDGRFYLAELPVRTGLGPTKVIALDSDGAVIGRAGLS
jgi:hypothetical protein